MAVVLGRPGSWTDGFDHVVTADAVKAYAAATNEADERFLSGRVASPMFATVPVRAAMAAAFVQAMPRGLPPSIPRLAGEQDIFFHQPIVPGMRLRCRACFMGIAPKASGTVLIYQIETRTDVDGLLNEQYMATFLPRVSWPEEAGERAPDHSLPVGVRETAPLASVVQRFDRDQTYRYAAASGDPSLWHLDDAFAKAAGLPGIIVHGLCTMAFMARAIVGVVGGGDLLRLRRLAVRFSRPLFPGDQMITKLWSGAKSAGAVRVHCEAYGPTGEPVITHALADVAA